MTSDIADKVFPVFLAEMRGRLRDALALADAAEAYLQNGDREGSFRIALDIEVLTAEADTLLGALSIVQRTVQGRSSGPTR